VRIVNVSSISHYMAAPEGIKWSTLGTGEEARVERSRLGTTRLNGQSKLVQSISPASAASIF
jgi:hypothetical protein